MRFLGCVLALAALASGSAETIEFRTQPREKIVSRLEMAERANKKREQRMDGLFQEAGCAEHLAYQPVKKARSRNFICTWPGKTDSVVVVCAHFDGAEKGQAAADNWSGASLLPSLFEDIKADPRKHTFVFVAFTGEERGLFGSREYVKQLTAEQRARIAAVVNLDTLGLSETEVWVSHSDKRLVNLISAVAKSMNSPLSGMNVDNYGTSDSQSFIAQKIPSIDVHSVTKATLPLLHTKKDNLDAIDRDAYFRSYRLVSAYLAAIDQQF